MAASKAKPSAQAASKAKHLENDRQSKAIAQAKQAKNNRQSFALMQSTKKAKQAQQG